MRHEIFGRNRSGTMLSNYHWRWWVFCSPFSRTRIRSDRHIDIRRIFFLRVRTQLWFLPDWTGRAQRGFFFARCAVSARRRHDPFRSERYTPSPDPSGPRYYRPARAEQVSTAPERDARTPRTRVPGENPGAGPDRYTNRRRRLLPHIIGLNATPPRISGPAGPRRRLRPPPARSAARPTRGSN